MAPIRVLLVDDAVVVRRLLTDILAAEPDIEVLATASNGRIALQRLTQQPPDCVVLDVEMPELDGLATLAEIRKTHPRLPVIMFSTLTERGAATTLEALALGASDYITKPSNTGSILGAREQVQRELLPRLRALCGRRAPARAAEAGVLPPPAPREPPQRTAGPRLAPSVARIVAIGVSTGGPNALAELIPALPAEFAAPVLVVQHMPPMFTRFLAERLDSRSPLTVREAAEGMPIEVGHVYIAPGDHHMMVERHGALAQVRLTQAPPENSCRPAADVLFRSVAAAWGKEALGVVLTGMGQDGMRGAEAIVEAGGRILAQDEATSVVWGMPGFVANAGLADQVLPLAAIGPEMIRRTPQPRLALRES